MTDNKRDRGQKIKPCSRPAHLEDRPYSRARRTAERTVGQGPAGRSARPRAIRRTPGGRGTRGESGLNARALPGRQCTNCTKQGWRHDEHVRGARGASSVPGHVPRGPQGGRGRIQGLVEARARAEVRSARCSTPTVERPPLPVPDPRGSRGVSRRLDRERVLPARPSRARETALGRAAGASRRATVAKPRLYHPLRARSSLTTHGSFIRSSKTHVRFFFVIVVFRQSSFVTSPGGARTRARSRPYPWR